MALDLKAIKRYEKKSVPDLLKIAQKWFNAYIRERDKKDGFFICISCNIPKGLDQLQAGHYLSGGHNAKTRFDEDNVNGQCVRCNMYLSGNQVGYRIGLVNKIGLDRVAAIETKMRTVNKWDRFTLIEIIETYKAKCKQFKSAH